MPPSPPHRSRAESLYIHVPFCAQKCNYCAFYSEASSGELMNRYVSALILEMNSLARGLRPKTIFFGGGTPSLLTVEQWKRLLAAMDRLQLLGAPEWTVECNPATLSADKARLLRDHGVNRISLGVQSLDETLLDRLGRIHSRDMVFKSFDLLRKAGFENINLDLMFAIPGQTLDQWRSTLAEAVALGSEHLSSYEVIYEEDTPLFARLQAGEFDVDEDLACAMYEEMVDRVTGAGFHQYEIANFARNNVAGLVDCWIGGLMDSQHSNNPPIQQSCVPSLACAHNVNYWRGRPFLGLGPSATSYINDVRTKNYANTPLYCELLERDRPPIESSEELAPLARAGETAAFGLRMVTGWPFAEFQRTTGLDLRQHWSSEMDELSRRGWARLTPDTFHLTSHGLRFADAAGEMFLR